uniref:Uncharacterized protein n=1 Tax=Trichogramma kaykai TaxID=54128 RepID=A0ABD2VZE7_9HYME
MSAASHSRDPRFDVTVEEFDIINVAKLRSLRERVDWEIEEQRSRLLDQLYPLIDEWRRRRRLPNLREIFRAREINWLLAEDLRKNKQSARFVQVLCLEGYRDEPDLEEATGRPLLQDVTPVHVGGRLGLAEELMMVFRMYPARSNYVDEQGYSHFHVFCTWASVSRFREFLQLRQDPNEPVSATGDRPLHLTIQAGDYLSERKIRALLRAGADPNLANEEGLTLLHCLCRSRKFIKDEWARKFFELCDEANRPVQVDAVDNQGWTPLRYAVATLLPDSVDALLNRGATVSGGFVFPTEFYSGGNDPSKRPLGFDLRHLYRAGGVLAIVERLENAGYELSRDDAMAIMRFFHDCGLFDVASEDNERSWYSDEKWAGRAKKIAVRDDDDPSQLSLYDLTRSSPKEAAKLLSYKDYFDLAVSDRILIHRNFLHGDHIIDTVYCRTLRTCAVHLAEKLSRGFFESWALDPFMRLIRDRLPILCCEMVLGNLRNVDLCSVQRRRQKQMYIVLPTLYPFLFFFFIIHFFCASATYSYTHKNNNVESTDGDGVRLYYLRVFSPPLRCKDSRELGGCTRCSGPKTKKKKLAPNRILGRWVCVCVCARALHKNNYTAKVRNIEESMLQIYILNTSQAYVLQTTTTTTKKKREIGK